MVNNISEIYKTSETPLAAYLVTEGYALVDVLFEGKRAFFLFNNDDTKLHADINDFQLLRAETNAAQLLYNYRELIKRTKRGY